MKRSNFFVLLVGMFLSCSLGAMFNEGNAPAFAIMVVGDVNYHGVVQSEKTWAPFFPELSDNHSVEHQNKKMVCNFYCHDPELKKWIDTQKIDSSLFKDSDSNRRKPPSNIPQCLVFNDDKTFKESRTITFKGKEVPLFIFSEKEVSQHIKMKADQEITSQVADYDIDKSMQDLLHALEMAVSINEDAEKKKIDFEKVLKEVEVGEDDSTENVVKTFSEFDPMQAVLAANKNITEERQHVLKGMVVDMMNGKVKFNNDVINYVLQSYEITIFLQDLCKKRMDLQEIKQEYDENNKSEKIAIKGEMELIYGNKLEEDQQNQENNLEENNNEDKREDDQTRWFRFPNISFLYDATWKKGVIFGSSILVLVCALLQSEFGQNALNKLDSSYINPTYA